MSKLYIVRGWQGSGKTTFAKSLNLPNHFEADMWFEKFNAGQFDCSKLSQAHAWCFELVRQAVERGEDCVVSNTFTRKWEYEPYTRLAAEIFIVNMQGNWPNIHGIPLEKVKQCKERMEY